MITVAIPFYNAERYLSEAIESVIQQTYTNWELLVVDDGSTDNSLTIARQYADKDERIKVISDGLNKNLGFRLNQIPSLVKTEYLARMDADDIMHPQRLTKQLKVFQDHPEIDVLGTNAYSINEHSKVVGIRMNPGNQPVLINVNHFIHPTIMAKTEWFKNNPYDVKAVRLEDTDLWYRTKECNTFMMITEPLFFYREFRGDFYKKYWKGYPTIFYLLKKYKKGRYLKWSISTLSNIVACYLYEKIFKSDFLIKRRNQVVFNDLLDCKSYM